jgi:hypothetical protein
MSKARIILAAIDRNERMTPAQRLAKLWKAVLRAKKVADMLHPRKHTNNLNPDDLSHWLPHRDAEHKLKQALRIWSAERVRQMTPTERARFDERAALRAKYTSPSEYNFEDET